MHLSVVIEALNAGGGICGGCGALKPRTMIAVSTADRSFGKRIAVCKDCMFKPGVQFTVDLPVKLPGAGKGLDRAKKRSRKSEAKTASEIGGTTTCNSGARFEDGDVVNNEWMGELKDIENRTYQLTARVLNKAMRQAAKQGKDWFIRLRMPTIKHDLVVMPWSSVVEYLRGDS